MGHPHDHKLDTDPNWDRLLKKVGKDLRSLRQGQGHSLANLTAMMGQQSGTAISQLERGERSGMTVYVLYKTARALGYDIEINFVRKGRTAKEKRDANTARESGDELSGGDPDRNVVQLRPVRSHPSGYTGHRGAH